MFRKILVPVDLAHVERGDEMITKAKTLCNGQQCNINLITVLPEIPAYVAYELPKEIRQKASSDAADSLESLSSKHGLPVTTTKVRHGSPHREILAEADSSGIDLIIVGSHKPGLEDYLLGSTAAKVVRHARCSVLVLR